MIHGGFALGPAQYWRDGDNFMLTHLSEMETPTLPHEALPISHPRTRAGRYLASLLTSTAESRHSLKPPFPDGSLDSHDRPAGPDPERGLCYAQPCAPGHGHLTAVLCATGRWERSGSRGVPGEASRYSCRDKGARVPAGLC